MSQVGAKILSAWAVPLQAVNASRESAHGGQGVFPDGEGAGLGCGGGELADRFGNRFGVSDELHQSFVPLREADPWDVIANAAGSLMGVTVWQKISPRLRLIQIP